MDYLKSIVFIFLITFAALSYATEFPTGSYKGTGFIVEKGTIKMTETDLSKFESNLTITKSGNSQVAFKILVKMQKYPGTPIKSDSRYDVYTVKWDSENSGSLTNNNKKYSGDKSTFIIDNKRLTIKSWISRNRLYETHIYEKQ